VTFVIFCRNNLKKLFNQWLFWRFHEWEPMGITGALLALWTENIGMFACRQGWTRTMD